VKLTRLDELPRHQLGLTFDSVGTSSPHWNDGYYFTFADEEGKVGFFCGLRLYANNDVMDAFTCIASAGRQHNMRFSRRLRPRSDDLECGAMSVEIIEGLRSLRICAGDNPYGIRYDLVWEGFTEPYNEKYARVYSGGRLVAERSNYGQVCSVTGWLEFAGRRHEVEGWTGVRDHSWGLGDTGGPLLSNASPGLPSAPIGLRQWAWAKFPHRAVFWQFHRSATGALTMFEAVCVYPYGDTREPVSYVSLEHDLEFVPGERRLLRGTVALLRADGAKERFFIEVITDPVYLEGGGYWQGFDDHRGRGVYRGDEHHEGEVWDVSHPTRVVDSRGVLKARPDAWAETFGRFTNLDDPSERGIGHLECVVSGRYPGFPDENR